MVKKAKKNEQSYREKSKLISQERRFRQKLTRISRYILIISIIILIMIGTWLEVSGQLKTFTSYAGNMIISLSSKAGLNLEIIYHDGLNMVTEEEFLKYLPTTTSQNAKTPIFSFSLTELKDDLESIGWIEAVNIERKLPNALIINVTERIAKAIWQYKGRLKLIDVHGQIITSNNVGHFNRLPIIVGEDANSFFESLNIFLSEDENLMAQIQSIIRIGGRRWNIRLKNNIEIKLPENSPDTAWRKLIKLQREQRILDRNIKTIDLRVEDRLFIQPINENSG